MMYMYVVCVGFCFYKVSNYGVDGGGGGEREQKYVLSTVLICSQRFQMEGRLEKLKG